MDQSEILMLLLGVALGLGYAIYGWKDLKDEHNIKSMHLIHSFIFYWGYFC